MQSQSTGRLDTQIHRRRAAPALGTMQAEWDILEGHPPVHLRMTNVPQSVAEGHEGWGQEGRGGKEEAF
ncbi:MAG: hypothetical protein NNA18_04875 [Nitrospira sp.]|nr:hypothetical protein [Nitrospira sp.]